MRVTTEEQRAKRRLRERGYARREREDGDRVRLIVFADALRDFLGLAPLYRTEAAGPRRVRRP
jgi:hypothetical protein